MSSDLIAWIVAIAFGLAVVVLGLRRDLGEATRDWLPRFGAAAATPEPSHGGHKRRQLSPRERRFFFWAYLLFGLCNAVLAVLSDDNGLVYAILAVLWAVNAVVLLLKGDPRW